MLLTLLWFQIFVVMLIDIAFVLHIFGDVDIVLFKIICGDVHDRFLVIIIYDISWIKLFVIFTGS
jgi:hypothetical protein